MSADFDQEKSCTAIHMQQGRLAAKVRLRMTHHQNSNEAPSLEPSAGLADLSDCFLIVIRGE